MICKECNKQILEERGSKYVHIKFHELASVEDTYYNLDRGNIYVCYECWKQISPTQYHTKEPFSVSLNPTPATGYSLTNITNLFDERMKK